MYTLDEAKLELVVSVSLLLSFSLCHFGGKLTSVLQNAKRYLKRTFVFDLLVVFPWEWLLWAIGHPSDWDLTVNSPCMGVDALMLRLARRVSAASLNSGV